MFSDSATPTVSIHASSREDATTVFGCMEDDNGFNPRVLAGGRDIELGLMTNPPVVSIHASSREDATYNLIWNEWFRDVSIHASSREDATSIPALMWRVTSCFNPRVLAGGRDLSE